MLPITATNYKDAVNICFSFIYILDFSALISPPRLILEILIGGLPGPTFMTISLSMLMTVFDNLVHDLPISQVGQPTIGNTIYT